jgi:hypothetical protein
MDFREMMTAVQYQDGLFFSDGILSCLSCFREYIAGYPLFDKITIKLMIIIIKAIGLVIERRKRW